MSLLPRRSERTVIPGPAGELQALIGLPAGAPSPLQHFAVVCHPHPLHGGTMDNKVVYALGRAFEESGAAVVRFNFRGVGTSAGSYDGGAGEAQDALAAIAYGRERWPGARLWIGGFSFGGAVALHAAASSAPDCVVAVAPAVVRLERLDVSGQRSRNCPWMIVQGDADEVLDAAQVLDWAATVEPPPDVKVLAGAGHFFHGRLAELGSSVQAFLRTLP